MFRNPSLENLSIKVSIPADEDEYLDRECPDEVCKATFKVLVSDWKDKVRDKEVFCPVCGHTAESVFMRFTDMVEKLTTTPQATSTHKMEKRKECQSG